HWRAAACRGALARASSAPFPGAASMLTMILIAMVLPPLRSSYGTSMDQSATTDSVGRGPQDHGRRQLDGQFVPAFPAIPGLHERAGHAGVDLAAAARRRAQRGERGVVGEGMIDPPPDH